MTEKTFCDFCGKEITGETALEATIFKVVIYESNSDNILDKDACYICKDEVLEKIESVRIKK